MKHIGKECHLIYCPRGSQMVNDRCVVIECPEGTVWTGHRSSVPEPIVHNLTFYNAVMTQFNQTKPDIILNKTNNTAVNAPLTVHDENNYSKDCNNDYDDCDDEISTTTPPTNLECCVVMTPRICKYHNNRWRCYSRRSSRCGEFCVAPIIYLKTSRIQ
ncbi:uncharacterized protein LOC135948996 [Calliphora vicina]|uniref:uncharacterized protein LOC135948996 n=1 Tax=Calliphora vicina TaxID=7373 RepID=UPI00325A4B4B